jgi:hypothetical protein
MKKITMLMAIALMSTGVMAQTTTPAPKAKATKVAKAPKAKAPKATKAKAEKAPKAPKAAKTAAPTAAPVQVNVSQSQTNK